MLLALLHTWVAHGRPFAAIVALGLAGEHLNAAVRWGAVLP